MPRSRARSLEQHYKDIIKRQKNEIRHLKKQLGHVTKEVNKYEAILPSDEEFEERMEEIEEEERVSRTCPKCGRETLKTSDLNVRILVTCKECGYRKSSKK